jgi:FixJ family two-component response regulator
MNNARATIYVVDDDVSVRDGLDNLLRSAGFRV